MLHNFQNNIRLQLLLLLGIGVFCYANTLNHGFVLDDLSVIQENTFVKQGIWGIPDIWKHSYLYGYTQIPDESYRPLPLTVFAVLYQMVGESPFSYHLFQVLFYLLLLAILYHYLRLFLHKRHPLIPFVVVALFAVHPVHTEVIANVKSLDEMLAFVCGASALLLHLKYLNSSKKPFLFYSLLCFFGALLSKEVGVTFIVLFPLQHWLFTQDTAAKVLRRNAWYILPFITYFILRYFLLENMTFREESFKLGVYNNGLLAANSVVEYVATAFTILLHYLKILFIPYPLSYDYSYQAFPIVGLHSVQAILSILIFTGLLIWGISAMIKRHTISFALWFFLATLSIYTNLFVKIGSTAADRFLFIPSLGIILLVVLLIENLRKQGNLKWVNTTSISGLLLFTILLYAGLTISRNNDWQSEEKLFLTDVETVPNSFRAHLFAASVYQKKANEGASEVAHQKLLSQSLRHLKQAYKIYPGFEDTYVQMAQNYRSLGQWKNMQVTAKAGLKLFPNNYSLQFLLGESYMNDGKNDKAAKQFQALLASSDSVHQFSSAYNLGALALNSGKFKDAEKYFSMALQQNPQDENSAYYLAMAKFQLEDYPACIDLFAQVSSNNPVYAHSQSSIGTCYLVMQEYEKALGYFKNALLFVPGDANILNNMAVAYQEMGMPEKAEECMAQINQSPGSGNY